MLHTWWSPPYTSSVQTTQSKPLVDRLAQTSTSVYTSASLPCLWYTHTHGVVGTCCTAANTFPLQSTATNNNICAQCSCGPTVPWLQRGSILGTVTKMRDWELTTKSKDLPLVATRSLIPEVMQKRCAQPPALATCKGHAIPVRR